MLKRQIACLSDLRFLIIGVLTLYNKKRKMHKDVSINALILTGYSNMMKKLLLTTALVSATAAFADGYTPMAKDFDIKLGGEFDFQAGFRSQKKEYTGNTEGLDAENQNKRGITANNKSVGFDTTADLYLDARNTTAQGMTYGAHIGIETTTASNRNVDNKHNNTSFMFMEHKDMGRLEAGSNADAANAMSVMGTSNASATGGAAGDWWKYVVLDDVLTRDPVTKKPLTYRDGMADPSAFILSPQISMDSDTLAGSIDRNTEKSRKLTYFTPKYNGFQAGLSYAPDVKNKGSVANLPSTATADLGLEDAFSLGLSWEGKMHKDHALKTSLTGVFGDPKHPNVAGTQVKTEDTKIMSIGAMYTFQDMVSFALSYTDYDKTGLLKSANTGLGTKKGHAWTSGLGLSMDKFTVSLTGMMSEKNKNKAKLYSLGADYKMAPGLMPYAEITKFDMKQHRTQDAAGVVTEANPALKNKGTAFILGTKVKF